MENAECVCVCLLSVSIIISSNNDVFPYACKPLLTFYVLFMNATAEVGTVGTCIFLLPLRTQRVAKKMKEFENKNNKHF